MTPKSSLTHSQILDQFYLDARARLLDLAATLDRLGRSEIDSTRDTDPRAARLRDAIALLSLETDDRAERLQLFFSLNYDPSWKRPTPRN